MQFHIIIGAVVQEQGLIDVCHSNASASQPQSLQLPDPKAWFLAQLQELCRVKTLG